jgi:hypothetical protein
LHDNAPYLNIQHIITRQARQPIGIIHISDPEIVIQCLRNSGSNGVNQIQEIFAEYSRMRQSGLDTKTALNALRSNIEALSKTQRAELAALMRSYETGTLPPEPKVPKVASIRPIAPLAPPPPPQTDPLVDDPTRVTGEVEQVVWVTCPNCGKANQQHEVFCYSCGQLLESGKAGGATIVFQDAGDTHEKDFFGDDSVLALRVRGSTNFFELRPQNAMHELIIGRSSDGSAMSPDVDLKDRKGADLGVSRMHLSIRYDPENHEVLATDLGSANGSFINGQRLMPKEVRLLRHGDELRLGKLVLAVSFRHPGNTVQE